LGVPENIYTHCKVSLEIPRARGNLKKHIFKESNCELKPEFQGDYRRGGGGGANPKNPLWEGCRYFLEQHM